ncbi:hypothetical protein Ptr902_08056 [Pyrenophora tritici-repentis]|nr:hypothetical protein Ptr902_08056 [Pyrenophora tritici-repentis]
MRLSTTSLAALLLLAAEQVFAATDRDGNPTVYANSCCGPPAQGPLEAPRDWCENKVGGNMFCCIDRLPDQDCSGFEGSFPSERSAVYYGNQLRAFDPPGYASTCMSGSYGGRRACVPRA